MRDGIVVLDNSCYPLLEDPKALAVFRGNLRVAGLVAAPSELNLLEAVGTSPPSVQQRLLATIRTVLADQPLLPWPLDVLRQTGEAFLRGDASVPLDFTGKEWYLDDAVAAAKIQQEALAAARDIEERFDQMHQGARDHLRKEMKKRGWVDSWESIPAFLDEYWRKSDMPQHFAGLTWKALGLPGDAPDSLLSVPAWRLMTDADGVGVYARALAHQQPKKVQRKDLLQLVYLAGSDRRVIATADRPFLDAATAVLAAHGNARAMHIKELLI